MQPTDILVHKIIQDQGIYPRFNTDPKRIELFCELLDCGTNLSPIKVVRENSSYILLDGTHRLEAFTLKGRKKIPAHIMRVEKRHWRLAAARFNTVSAKPLTGEELRKTIRDAWQIDGIRDTDEIAQELNCSVEYVRRVLKPFREADRENLRKQVAELSRNGLSDRQIGARIGKPKRTVQRLRVGQNGTSSVLTHPERQIPEAPPLDVYGLMTEETSVKAGFISAESGNSQLIENMVNKNGSNGHGHSSEDSDESSNSGSVPPSDSSDECHSVIPQRKNANRLQNAEEPPLESVVGYRYRHRSETGNTTCKDSGVPFEEPPSAIPELSKYHTWRPSEKETLRAMELIRAGWNVQAIAKKLGKTEPWVRNTAAALIAIYQSETDHHPRYGQTTDHIADALDIADGRLTYLADYVQELPGIVPKRETIFGWLRENAAPYRTGDDVLPGSLTDIMQLETIYLKCVNDGIRPPWEETEQPGLSELQIEEIFEEFTRMATFFVNMARLIRQHDLNNVMETLIQRYNQVVTAENRFRDALRQRDQTPLRKRSLER